VSRNKDNKLDRDLSKSLKKAKITDKRTKPDQEDTQTTQEGSKEDRITLMMKDEYRKEIKRKEKITQINIRMKCILKEKTLQTFRLKRVYKPI
jgi:hypothetical protein